MSLVRETVFKALFAQLESVAGLITTSRTLVSVHDVPLESLPAAYQIQGKQVTKKLPNLPPAYVLEASWIVYALSNDPAVSASTVLNPILDGAVAALTPGPADTAQTLGGIVLQCAISGEVEVIEGVLGDRAVAIIPIQIIVSGP